MTAELLDIDSERPRLLGLAYQMLGTVADAEDAVQEAVSRFYALPEQERATVHRPGAWLMRTTGRVALDVLKPAHRKRELYVGEWLPEPIPGRGEELDDASPESYAVLQTEVSYGLMVVLERLSPAERAVFVLRESFGLGFSEISEVVLRSPGACRQLASEARKKIQAGKATRGSEEDGHTDLVRAFAQACATGDIAELTRLLDPSVELRSDGGGIVSAARRPVITAENVAKMLVGLRQKFPEAGVELVTLAGGEQGALFRLGEEVGGLLACGVVEGAIEQVWIMRNPEKLRLWQ
ncbi:RNA polymerase sigma factor SigJ [Nesterenkonia sp. MY13]|uniref:RNA polymerase sigma factor SigJ n=1 Tax=Nesterenkonia sedimenti TaxID=1463632 RepID=A0A7X8TKE2_9MICC|nr:RNA polymerase sigma factor SigJ [Nesterenkonia sedimenti]NLS10186.1 RNA polymerase sigma factor SigJ [Nesterenkonia sedimenti]